MKDVLGEILARKRREVEERKKSDRGELGRRLAEAPPPRSFLAHLRREPPCASGLRIIAEFKRASPSKGPIRPDADPVEITRAYQAAGAVALSVLTDGPSFGGSLEDLETVSAAVTLPVLRKEFIIDVLQIREARAAGADAVLLIAAALSDGELRRLAQETRDLGMEPLLEVHDAAEMERACAFGDLFGLVGINNRDLKTLEVDLETTRRLIDLRPKGALVVSESGFSRREDMEAMRARGADAFLIGEHLLRSPDPGRALLEITGGRR